MDSQGFAVGVKHIAQLAVVCLDLEVNDVYVLGKFAVVFKKALTVRALISLVLLLGMVHPDVSLELWGCEETLLAILAVIVLFP